MAMCVADNICMVLSTYYNRNIRICQVYPNILYLEIVGKSIYCLGRNGAVTSFNPYMIQKHSRMAHQAYLNPDV
jgi:hypothetical protein